MYFRRITFIIVIVLIIWACENDSNPEPVAPPTPPNLITSSTIFLNPSGFAPLSAEIVLETSEAVRVNMRVVGQNGAASDVVQEFPTLGSNLEIPVHGLYADFNNTIELTFFNTNGDNLGMENFQLQTEPLIPELPQINIDTADRDAMAPGMTLVSYFGHTGDFFPQRPFMFDAFGAIRWYLNYSGSNPLGNLFYDDGIERLANGNFYFGDRNSDAIYEIDLYGTIVNQWLFPGFLFHHEVSEKPNGNFLVTVDKEGANTVEDYIIEIDRDTKQIIREWNLNESLDNKRTTFTDDPVDWVHVNAITYDLNDDTIILSGRTQGLIKLTNANEVVWIMGSHKDWALSGNGLDLNQFLLQPLDISGAPITDVAVLEGDENHPDFEWNWYQHAPEVMPNGNVILFDNGDNRNFVGNTYSRAVEYKIDTANKTIQQVWEYGKNRGAETYSRIVSDVDYLETEDHVLMSPGAVLFNGLSFGKSIEVDYSSGDVIFEATMFAPLTIGPITLHRTERLTLYPSN